jgi:hypothetical protein
MVRRAGPYFPANKPVACCGWGDIVLADEAAIKQRRKGQINPPTGKQDCGM